MLGLEAAEARIRKGEIAVAYALDPDNPSERLLADASLVDPSDPKRRSTVIFRNNYFGDRLALTLGPLVYSHSRSRKMGRSLYKSRSHCFDLRETHNKLVLEPGETLTVETIEHVKLTSDVAATILPRLSLANSGIMVSPTYIDPCWDGILQLHIQNQSPHSYELSVGEKVAICRFYPLEGRATPTDCETFPRKSHHYGLGWETILGSDRDPFPFRKQRASDSGVLARVSNAGTWLLRNWQKMLTGAFLAGLIGSVVWLYAVIEDLSELQAQASKVTELERQLAEQDSRLGRLEEIRPLSGSTSVIVPSGQRSGSILLELPVGNANSSALAFAQTAPIGSVKVEAQLTQASSVSNWQLRITVTQLEGSNSSQEYEVTYVVIPN